jgi:hypothetical protein
MLQKKQTYNLVSLLCMPLISFRAYYVQGPDQIYMKAEILLPVYIRGNDLGVDVEMVT